MNAGLLRLSRCRRVGGAGGPVGNRFDIS